MINKIKYSILSLFLLLFTFVSFAGEPIPTNRVAKLSDYKGKSFLAAMISKKEGIKAMLDEDNELKFTVVDYKSYQSLAEKFDESVIKKTMKLFKGGEKGFKKFLTKIAGEETTPLKFVGLIANALEDTVVKPDEIALTATKVAPMLGIMSGSGVTVILDKNNFFYNYGFKPTSDKVPLAKALKSGRSFSESGTHPALDSSDVLLLKNLDTYLASLEDPSDFYSAFFKLILNSDSSGLKKLSEEGQALVLDIFTVYTAELDRHIEAGLGRSHPWENDLAEATMVSGFVVREGKIKGEEGLIEGKPVDFFGVGKQGSGIGETRRDRRTLQLAVTNALEKSETEDAAIVSKARKILELKKGSDVMKGFMEFVNNKDNLKYIEENSNQLEKLMVEFMVGVWNQSKTINKAITKSGFAALCPANLH